MHDPAHNVARAKQDQRYTTQEITQAVSQTLIGIPTKEIVDATGGSIRAAQNAREGLNAMSLTHFFNAAVRIPELKALAMQLLRAEEELDPRAERARDELIRAAMRLADARRGET